MRSKNNSKKNNTLTVMIVIVLLAVIGFSGYNIAKIALNYHKIDVANEEIVEKYVYEEKDGFPQVDFATLQAHKDVYILLPDGRTMRYSASVGKYISINDDVYVLPKYGEAPETLVLSTCTDDSSDVERFVLICNYEETV